MDDNCIFCKVVAGKAPAEKLGETDDLLIIPDISAQAPVHLLFVSKSHGEELATVDTAKLGRMITRLQQEIRDRGLTNSSYRIAINGAKATLVHNHLHIHLLGQVSPQRPM